jgi:predicted PurR-regulated permease PerM
MMGSHSRLYAACHHRSVSGSADADTSPLAVTPSWAQRLAPRFKLDWATFLAVVAAVLIVLTVLAVFANSTAMLTRISIGLLIALALDPLVDILERRLHIRRGFAVAATAVAVLGVAGLLIAVLAPRAVAEAQEFSEQFPDTVGQLERLPLVGDWIGEQNLVERAELWVDQLPEQFTDERLGESARSLVSGVVGVAIVAVFAIAVLVDGENLVARFRKLLKPERRAAADEVGRVVYATLGRYIGGSVTVAGMMGVFVLTVGLILGVPLAPLAAVWAMITDLIPQVGGALGGVVFVALALTESVPTALIAGGLFVAYMTFENHVIQPAIVGRSVDLTPPTTMVAAFVGGAVAGVPGALLATPLVGAAKQLILEARGRRPPLPPAGEEDAADDE